MPKGINFYASQSTFVLLAGLPQAVPGDYGKYKSTTEKNKVVIILFNISLIPGQNNLKASKACSVNAIAFSS